ncbi:Pheromone-processing carboxypeptidase kex1 [Labeo rohita]|uniref:Pheromone-processing carboxypeptidase kex1 n=1 Tax=Labeo rohita TaxID=84645 RepID=A0ABQ8MNM7_LABRO|nr:Pheromone-processing carboxypeptidase kex1 [Labeo rohita]
MGEEHNIRRAAWVLALVVVCFLGPLLCRS